MMTLFEAATGAMTVTTLFVLAWVALFSALGFFLWIAVQIGRLAQEGVRRRRSFYEELRRRGYYK